MPFLCVKSIYAKTMNEHLVIQLLHKQYTGVLEVQDKSILDNWLSQSPDNELFCDSIKQIWDYSANYQPTIKFENTTESAFEKFAAKINEEKVISSPATSISSSTPLAKIVSFPLYRWIAGAAACAVLVFSGYWLTSNDNNLPLYTELSTLEGQTENIKLVDNSQLWINEKASISYFTKKDSRNVVLKGEAFFEVSKSDDPFVIVTDNAEITVVGTAFNVDANESFTKVEVKEGVVELKPLNSNQTISLSKNQTGIYDAVNKRLYREQSKSYNGDSWLTGGISFEDATLKEVFSTLEDYFKLEIIIENEDLLHCVFTSPVYQDSKIDEVLGVMQVVYNFEYKIDKRSIVISGGECN